MLASSATAARPTETGYSAVTAVQKGRESLASIALYHTDCCALSFLEMLRLDDQQCKVSYLVQSASVGDRDTFRAQVCH